MHKGRATGLTEVRCSNRGYGHRAWSDGAPVTRERAPTISLRRSRGSVTLPILLRRSRGSVTLPFRYGGHAGVRPYHPATATRLVGAADWSPQTPVDDSKQPVSPVRSAWNRLILSILANESVIEVFSCSGIMLQSRHETYLPLTNCVSNYPTVDGRRQRQKGQSFAQKDHGSKSRVRRDRLQCNGRRRFREELPPRSPADCWNSSGPWLQII